MKLNIMDRTGHTTQEFDVANTVSLKEAMDRFDELTKKKGYIANVPGKGGAPSTHLKAFDPTVEEIDFFPQLIGG